MGKLQQQINVKILKRMLKKKYRIYTYDLIGNESDGFEVNDLFPQGDVAWNLPAMSDRDIIQGLKKMGVLSKWARNSRFQIDGDESYLYINYNDNPVCEFREL